MSSLAGGPLGDPLAASRGVQLLCEAGPILAVNKPAGLATQAPAGIDSMEARIKSLLRARSGVAADASVYLGVPHRLDRAASGVLVFATTRRAARSLSKQFARRTVQKLYWTLVERLVEPPEGQWTDYLWKVYGQPQAQLVPAAHPGGQLAALRYRTIGRHPAGAWLEIDLETGRTHQVRVQAASRGHPIVGDELYGSRVPFGPPCDDERLRPIALHARLLSFVHLDTRERVTVLAPPPANWPSLPAV